MNKTEILAHLISLVLIILYSSRFFNMPLYTYSENSARFKGIVKPSPPKFMTEPAAYRFYKTVFVGLIIGVYIILTMIIDAAEAVEQFEGTNANFLVNLVKEHKEVAIIMSALAIIGVTKYPKWISELLEGLRDLLHDYANVPIQGRKLFDRLFYTKIDYNHADVKERIKRILKADYIKRGQAREDLSPDFFEEKNRKEIKWKWARLSYIIDCIMEDRQNVRTRKCLDQFSIGWKRLYIEYLGYADDLVQYRGNEFDDNEKKALNREIEHLLFRTYRLLSCLLIIAGKSETDPMDWLKKYGFDIIPESRNVIDMWKCVRAGIFVFLAITATTFITSNLYYYFTRTGNIATLNEFITINVSAGIIMLIPVAIVFCFKRSLSAIRSWPSIDSRDNSLNFFDRPFRIYFGIALICWVISTVLMYTFFTVFSGGQTGDTVKKIGDIVPFTFIAALTVFFVSYRIDIPPIDFHKKWRLYFKVVGLALVQGIMTGLAVYMAYVIVGRNTEVDVGFHCLLGFVAGTTLGFSLFLGKHKKKEQEAAGV